MEMTLEEKVELLNKLREEYEEGENEDIIIRRINELHLEDVDFIYDKEHRHGKLFVCPDLEWEFPKVFEIAEEYMTEAIGVIYDAICLYYRESSFWDYATSLTDTNLIKIYTRLRKIPIIRFFPVTKVELLNVRKLNKDI